MGGASIDQTFLKLAEPNQNTKSVPKKFPTKFIALILGVIVLILTILGGAFYLVKIKSQPQKSATQTQLPEATLNSHDQSSPKIALSNFLEAAKAKNYVLAKTLISENSNKEVFKTISDTQYSGTSIYKKNFTYDITDVKNNDDQVSAELKVKITVSNQSLPIAYLLGKENGKWYLLDEWTLVSSVADVPSNFIDLLNNPKSSNEASKAVIRLSGPAHLSIYSPVYGNAGFGTNSVNSASVIYVNQDDPTVIALRERSGLPKLESMSLDLSGVWILKVTGTMTGDYSIETEIVDPKNHQISTLKSNIKSGEVKYFSLTNPTDLGVPISTSPLN